MKLKQRLTISYIQTKFKVLSGLSKKKAAKELFQLFCTPLTKSIDNNSIKNAEKISFVFKTYTIRGYRWNAGQSKKALILHGFSSAAHKFKHFVQPLIDKGYEVIAYDCVAHGSSEGSLTNAVEYGEMIVEIIKNEGSINSFIAHSFGGLALSLALEQIPHSPQTKAVLIAPATESTTALSMVFKLLKLDDPEVKNEVNKLIFDTAGKKIEWFSVRRAIKNINAQILFFQDEDDDITPMSDAIKIKEDNHKHVNFVTTKKLGHRRIYHDVDVKKQVIDFL
jgi:pimeloyl-ACP methyl ester carboxylesterase